jgi:hypothetical protein
MQPPSPYRDIGLVGRGTLRTAIIELPTEVVRGFLPAGVMLGPCPEDLGVAKGSHPILLFFYDMFAARMNVPVPLPRMTYHEHVFGVPYAFTTPTAYNPGYAGPFFWMPLLLLNDIWATSGGVWFWGFPKRMADIQCSASDDDWKEYVVSSGRGAFGASEREPFVSCRFRSAGERVAVYEAPYFRPVREILDQPMLTSLPAGMGPWLVCSNFQKIWQTAELEPLETRVTVHREYVQGVPTGAFPSKTRHSPGLTAKDPTGSFVLHSDWRMGLVYPTWFHSARAAPSILQH